MESKKRSHPSLEVTQSFQKKMVKSGDETIFRRSLQAVSSTTENEASVSNKYKIPSSATPSFQDFVVVKSNVADEEAAGSAEI